MFSGIDIVFEGNMLVLEGDAFGGRVLTGLSVVLVELWFSVLCWELWNVETAFGSERFVTVAPVLVNSSFITPLVVVPSPVTVVNERTVDSGGVFKDSLVVVPLGDIPTTGVITGLGKDVVFGVNSDVFAALTVAEERFAVLSLL